MRDHTTIPPRATQLRAYAHNRLDDLADAVEGEAAYVINEALDDLEGTYDRTVDPAAAIAVVDESLRVAEEALSGHMRYEVREIRQLIVGMREEVQER